MKLPAQDLTFLCFFGGVCGGVAGAWIGCFGGAGKTSSSMDFVGVAGVEVMMSSISVTSDANWTRGFLAAGLGRFSQDEGEACKGREEEEDARMGEELPRAGNGEDGMSSERDGARAFWGEGGEDGDSCWASPVLSGSCQSWDMAADLRWACLR